MARPTRSRRTPLRVPLLVIPKSCDFSLAITIKFRRVPHPLRLLQRVGSHSLLELALSSGSRRSEQDRSLERAERVEEAALFASRLGVQGKCSLSACRICTAIN